MNITAGAFERYINCRVLEAFGWREECPLPKDWVFSHPTFGTHFYPDAVNIQFDLFNGAD